MYGDYRIWIDAFVLAMPPPLHKPAAAPGLTPTFTETGPYAAGYRGDRLVCGLQSWRVPAMSAPATELPSSSISSSGHVDGLGRRSLSFDRSIGEILERVHVRPELAVFEQLLRQRVTHLATLEDERFALPSAVERDSATGELTVLAEFVTGSRLSELLDASADAAAVPGVDVALGYLLETLPALSILHTGSGVTHGLIDPSRTVVTPEGQVVFLDAAFGSAVERLNLSRFRLWTEFGVTTPTTAPGPVRFDPAGDIAQVALGALMLVLGRNLRTDEYPQALPSLLMEVIEVAHIRGTTGFAGGLQRILQRSLPLPSRRPYTTADEVVVDVRQLVRREIGVDVCRRALIDFVAQMDAALTAAATVADAPAPAIAHDRSTRPESKGSNLRVPELDEFLDTFNQVDSTEVAKPEPVTSQDSGDAPLEVEISLDHLEPIASEPSQLDEVEEVYELPPLDEVMLATDDPTRLSSGVSTFMEPQADAPDLSSPDVAEVPVAHDIAGEELATFVEDAPAASAQPSPQEEVKVVESESESEPEPETEAGSRRRKRHQQKSARARKDKLRSTSAVPKTPPQPVSPAEPPPIRPSSPTGWLVSAQRATVFEPPVEPHPTPALPPPPRPQQVPAVPSFAPTPVGPLPQPVYSQHSAPTPVFGTPATGHPPAAPVTAPVQPAAHSPAAVKVKADPPGGFTPPRGSTYVEPPAVHPNADRFGTLSLGGQSQEEDPRSFPWKLAAVAVAVAAIAIVVGRSYLPGRPAVAGEPGAQVQTPASTPSLAPAPEDTAEGAIPTGKGRLSIQTQPAGIKVLLDRKPIGETPLKVDVPAGRRVLTFITSGGEVLHSVRVVAGKTTALDVPVFSGWVAVFAPIVLDIAEAGHSLGTTEQSRLMLPPGRHELTLSNVELGYSAVQIVDIEPGTVKSITVEPKGTADVNAVPWAEVWLDGQKLGETPLARIEVPLGLREFVFKHPQYGERRVSATIRADAPSPITVDFTK